VFCAGKCKRTWHSWREAKGAQAVELLIRWRGRRLPGGFTALTAFADDLFHEYRDREGAILQRAAEAQP
jgi:molybdenum-dependent DNA-binding transcriptional regulator ModE